MENKVDQLEGRNPIQEALRAGRPINKIWIQKRGRNTRPDPEFSELVNNCRAAGAVVMTVERKVLDQMATSHGHQGIIAQVAAHTYADLDTVLEAARASQQQPFFLLLDEIQESYNLGSILRIADAAGVHAVIIPERRAVALDAAVAKASAGAIEYVPVVRVVNLTQTVLRLKEEGFWVFGTDAAGTTPYNRVDWGGPIAILIGGEHKGLGEKLRAHCDFLVSIPMQGRINSLNAAVAAGIVIFAAADARKQIAHD